MIRQSGPGETSQSGDSYISFRRSMLDGVEIKRCRSNPQDYKPHVHAELSLGYIVAGSTEVLLNDRKIRFQAGDGVMIPPLMSHSCNPENLSDWEYIMLFIQPSVYEAMVTFPGAQRITGMAAAQLHAFITQLLHETDPEALESILLDLLLSFGNDREPGDGRADTDAMETIHRYIAAHVYEPVSLATLAAMAGVNKFTLIRNFKKIYVTTPAAFHLQCRVAEARNRMQHSGDILTIGSELGFYDQAHLIREFKKMYGITPAAYRQQLS